MNQSAISLQKVKTSMERLLDKTMSDMIRGIRASKDCEGSYVAMCLVEIKRELKVNSIDVKANAIQKLLYLQLLGYDISWAAFNMIEVSSSSRFTYKRIGYLVSSQCFHDDTDVIMLATNMIRKDLNSHNIYHAGAALSSLSCFMTPDLARDLVNDILSLISSTRPYLRKKSVLVLYKVLLRYPEALRPVFHRLKDHIEDPDPGVQCAAVNVVSELARHNPKNYLFLAPQFFKLMSTSTNNWMLIKIIKLFGSLVPLEPRLAKKLHEPLINMLHNTTAVSLLYECINTVIAGDTETGLSVCLQKLRGLMEDPDQNLRYLGLLAVSRVIKRHPKAVAHYKGIVMDCLEDKDESIRRRALDLLYAMVSRKSLMEIVKKLVSHMETAEGTTYRGELLCKIVEVCSHSNYQYVSNFEWYVSVLVELTKMEGVRHGEMLARQLMDVAIRVTAIRGYTVEQMASVLENEALLSTAAQRVGLSEVLFAAAWIAGEFREFLPSPWSTLAAMLDHKVLGLPGHIQSIYLQNSFKIYSRLLQEREPNDCVPSLTQTMVDSLRPFAESNNLEVQERACIGLELLKYVKKLEDKGVNVVDEVVVLFDGSLNPVAPKAQRKVPVPPGLDLDVWINEPPKATFDDGILDTLHVFGVDAIDVRKELDDDELKRLRKQRKSERDNNPHYLKSPTRSRGSQPTEVAVGLPPDSGVASASAELNSATINDKRGGKSRRKQGKRLVNVPRDVVGVRCDVIELEMPDGAKSSDDNMENDPHKNLNVNLDKDDSDADYQMVNKSVSVSHTQVAKGEVNDVNAKSAETKRKQKHKKRTRRNKSDDLPIDHVDNGVDPNGCGTLESSRRNYSTQYATTSPEHKPKTGRKTSSGKKQSPKREQSPLLDQSQSPKHPKSPRDKVFGDQQSVQDEQSPKHQVKQSPKQKQSPKHKESPKRASKVFTEDDVEFWLIPEDVNNVPETTKEQVATPEKVKKGHRKRQTEKRNVREEFETIEGDVNPCVPDTPLCPVTMYRPLGETEFIRLDYRVQGLPTLGNVVEVGVVFANKTDNLHIRNLELTVVDSINAKMCRDAEGLGAGLTGSGYGLTGSGSVAKLSSPTTLTPPDSVAPPFQLPPGAVNETHYRFNLATITATQSLRGTLTLTARDIQTGDSTSDILDFKIKINSSAFLLGTSVLPASFTKLVSSDELSHRLSTSLPCTLPSTESVTSLLYRISCELRLFLVERVANTASLYGISVHGHQLCFLLKFSEETNCLKIDGKSSDSVILSCLIEQFRLLIGEISSGK